MIPLPQKVLSAIPLWFLILSWIIVIAALVLIAYAALRPKWLASKKLKEAASEQVSDAQSR